MSAQPTIRVAISAEIRATNGVTVEIEQGLIRLTKPGPRGGQNAPVEIPVGEWPMVDAAVRRVLGAITDAREAVDGSAS